MPFHAFQQALALHFDAMASTGLYRVAIGKDGAMAPEGQQRPSRLWTTYLGSFPAGSNPRYRTRTEHDCSCCRHFLRNMGGVVTIRDGALVTLWDVQVAWPYQPVADTLAALVRETAAREGISDVFLATTPTVGVAQTRELLPQGLVKTWEHFCVNVPVASRVPREMLGSRLAEARSTHDVFLRALTELTIDALDTALALIADNTLYRGAEHLHTVQEFVRHKRAFDGLPTAQAQDLYCWAHMQAVPGPVARIRTTALGTLLVDLSEGRELEDAVRAYERVMAPANYQRPTALVGKQQIAHAQTQVDALGLLPALERRYAVIEDITITNVLWADRSARKTMGVFEQLAEALPIVVSCKEKAQDIPVEHFLAEVLPGATRLEVLVEHRHVGNFVSLIAPVDASAPRLFQWNNGFSWTYNGDMADSMKQRVKRAGGNVAGDFRASVAWYNYDDLDLHLREPGGFEIFFANGNRPRRSPHGGQLDVDMNAGSGSTRTPVENIAYPSRHQMAEGEYTLFVHQYAQREHRDTGFEAEIEFDGEVYAFCYEKPLRQGEQVRVARFAYSHHEGVQIVESLPQVAVSRSVWEIPTQTMRKVNVVMLSPNYWDGQQGHGNKHWFFMIEGCVREGTARGLFNEYLRPELRPHRQVLERVGAQMHTEEAARQLSGLGFSSTLRNTLVCRVEGRRMYNVIF